MWIDAPSTPFGPARLRSPVERVRPPHHGRPAGRRGPRGSARRHRDRRRPHRAVGRGLGPSRETIDAGGRLVAPGFVDIHTHSDFTLPLRPQARGQAAPGRHHRRHRQLRVLAVPAHLGHLVPAPWRLHRRRSRRALGDARRVRRGARGPRARHQRRAADRPRRRPARDPGRGRRACRRACDRRDGRRSCAPRCARARSARRRASSTRRARSPTSTSSRRSRRVVAEEGGIYATHMRNEGDHLAESVAEAIEVGRRSHCPVQISHLKALGRRNWGRVEAAIAQVEHAHSEGVDVCVDAYPYTAGSSTLVSLLPADELDGGIEALHLHLDVPDERARLVELLEQGVSFDLDGVMLATVPSRPELGGQRLVDAAQERGRLAGRARARPDRGRRRRRLDGRLRHGRGRRAPGAGAPAQRSSRATAGR